MLPRQMTGHICVWQGERKAGLAELMLPLPNVARGKSGRQMV
jgi:hypothetical protein